MQGDAVRHDVQVWREGSLGDPLGYKDQALNQVIEEFKEVWSEGHDHAQFVDTIRQLLAPRHQSVQVHAKETTYRRVHTDFPIPCAFEWICEEASAITVADLGVLPICVQVRSSIVVPDAPPAGGLSGAAKTPEAAASG